jgi:predicted nucleic acid-binding protein
VAEFVDTNILVYAEDKDEGEKHKKARDLILKLWDSGGGVVSIQVLQEFFVTVTRKVKKPLKPETAQKIVEQYLTWRVIENTGSLLLAGIQLSQSSRLSFWDALVVQAAMSSGCEVLYSENLSHAQAFNKLRIINPLL